MRILGIGGLLFAVSLVWAAERESPASPEELAGITERGRLLAAYDESAWKATDSLQDLKPERGGLGQYIARKTESGWSVAFGRLDEAREAFLVAYEATRRDGARAFSVEEIKPPRRDTRFYLFAARAAQLALADFQGEQRPYNVAVLPAPDSKLHVYIMPAQTKDGVYPLGGDARYLVSTDGLKIVEKRQMHKAILEVEYGKGAVAGVHSAVLDDVPEDTDVFHVLAREPKMPEWVATPKFVYVVNPDGSIKYVMRSDAMKKIQDEQKKREKP